MTDRLSLDWLLMCKGFEQGNKHPSGHKVQTMYLLPICKIMINATVKYFLEVSSAQAASAFSLSLNSIN